MKRILSLLLSALLVLSIVPMTVLANDTDVVYQTIVDMSDYDGVTLKEYASPWFTEGLTRSYNIGKTSASYDAETDSMKITRGAWDPCGLYYFDKENLPLAFSDSLGFRVWIKGDEASGADVTANNNFVFAVDTVDETGAHVTYGAFWYDGPTYKVVVPAEGAWVEFRWADLVKNWRVVGSNGMNANRPNFSGAGAIVDYTTFMSKVDGFAVGFKKTGSGKIYYVGDMQLIKPAVSVTFDGTVVKGYTGERIEVPAPTTDGVIAYTDGKNIYYPGDEYTIPGETTLTNITTVVDADSDHDFVFDTADKTYTGSEICPAVSSATLTEGVDYTVEYENNVKAGTGKIYVRGTGSCYIDLSAEFTIVPKTLETTDFTLEDGLVYTGTALTPKVSSNVFSADDYTVVYHNNVNASENAYAIVEATHKNGYGSVQIPFSIAQKEISDDMFTIDLDNKVFTDMEICPEVTSETLGFSTDYTVGYSNNINVGTANIFIEGIGNYCGRIDKTFSITQKEITADMFTVNTDAKVYTAKEITTDIASTLTENDYEVAYTNNVDTGVATVTITGIGNYAGTLTYEFVILQKETLPEDFTIDLDAKDYTGKEICPSVTSDVLQDKDYVVYYKNNVNAGTATITVVGLGNLKSEFTKEFTINKKTLTADDFEIDLSDAEYENEEICPEIISTLTQGVDYTVVYSDNLNVGTAKITITACGDNCQGEVELEFAIVQRELKADDFTLAETEYVFDNCEYTPAVSSALKDSDYTVVYSDNKNAGTATVTITGKDNCKGEAQLTFTITPKEISADWFALKEESVTYTGADIEVEVVSELVKDADFTVAYKDNKNTGTATVTVTGIGNYQGSQQYTFFIGRKSVEESMFSVDTTSKVFVNGEIKPEITSELVLGTDYSVLYTNNTNVGTAEIIITGLGNYDGQVAYAFEITPDTLLPIMFSVDATVSYIYDGTAKELPHVSLLIPDVDYTVAYENNVNAGTATVVFTGIGNYSGEVRVDYTIAPATISKSNFKVSTAKMYYSGKALKKTIKSTLPLLTSDNYTVAYKNNTRVGTATITITGKANFTGTVKYTFKIVKPTVKRTAKITLAGGAKKITVKYKKVSKADGYVIQYSLKKNFKGKKTVYVSKKYAKKVLKKLKSGKKYYVRVAAYRKYKKTGSSKTYKAIGKFRTKSVKVK